VLEKALLLLNRQESPRGDKIGLLTWTLFC